MSRLKMLASLFVNGADFVLLVRSIIKSTPIWLHPGLRLIVDLVPIALITTATVLYDLPAECPYSCKDGLRLLGFWLLIANVLV
jgi:hypothetical protein